MKIGCISKAGDSFGGFHILSSSFSGAGRDLLCLSWVGTKEGTN